MISTLKPYPAYKDSGVEWLGKVPEHWEVRRLGSSVRGCVNGVWGSEPNGKDDLPCVRVADFDRFRLRVHLDKPTLRAIKSSDRVRRLLEPGDLLLEKSGGGDLQPVGRVVLYDHSTVAVTSNFIARMPVENGYDAIYLTYLHAALYSIELNVRSIKQTTGIQNLDSRIYLSELVAFPPLPEQTAIVRFLDYMDRRIRRYIRAKQKLIKLLTEYKQALINQAVTGKIDVRTGKPYPAYKDSGVEWLGQVPEHWEVRRIKRIARLNPSKSEVPLALRDSLSVFLPMNRVGTDGRFDVSELQPITALWNGFTYFRRGDVIIAKITPCFENGKGACLQNLPTSVGFGSTEFHVIRPSAAVTAPYLYRVTTISEFRRLGADEMTGAAGQQRVSAEFIANFLIPLPPLPEQTAIAEYLNAQTSKIDAAISAARREIELLREYRERLIADVVTGKVDVRNVKCEAGSVNDGVEEDEVGWEEAHHEDGEAENELEQEDCQADTDEKL